MNDALGNVHVEKTDLENIAGNSYIFSLIRLRTK